MGKQWGTREPNSEEKTCALPGCEKVFWTASYNRIYCSPEHSKQAKINTTNKYQKAKRPKYSRVCPVCKREFVTTNKRKVYDKRACYLKVNRTAVSKTPDSTVAIAREHAQERAISPNASEGFLRYLAMETLTLDEDPVYERVGVDEVTEWDQEEVLSYIHAQLGRGQIIYGKYAELVSEPPHYKVVLARLEKAIDNVPQRRIEEARMIIRAEEHQRKSRSLWVKLREETP